MGKKIVKPERRRPDGRQDRLAALGDAVGEGGWAERRIHCWHLEPGCTEDRRKQCAAHFVRRNCWDLWGAEYFPPGRKPCCHKELDCAQCPVAAAKFGGVISIHVEVPQSGKAVKTPVAGGERSPQYCPFLYSPKEAVEGRAEGESRPPFRCQRRRGIHLHSTYVSEVCSSSGYRECAFYDTK